MIKSSLKKFAHLIGSTVDIKDETALLAIGAMLSKQQFQMTSTNINDYEFKIFSQWGDDGIIQYLIKNISIQNKTFIEFGVENYQESNTRFLMMNDNWSGFVMDGSAEAMESVKKRDWYWKYNLTCKSAFINMQNINELLEDYENISLLHIDLDGNDYYILQKVNLKKLNPAILIVEYNALFGNERNITIPYSADFVRTKAHFSNLYYGASLGALNYLAEKKGYSLIGCNNAGNNAYFIRNDLLNEKIKKVDVKTAFKDSNFRESKKPDGELSYLAGWQRFQKVANLDVVNVVTEMREKL